MQEINSIWSEVEFCFFFFFLVRRRNLGNTESQSDYRSLSLRYFLGLVFCSHFLGLPQPIANWVA